MAHGPAPGAPAPTIPTTPTKLPPHGTPLRGLDTTPSSSTSTGRFGRMFRHLPTYSLDPNSLAELGLAMIQGLEDGKLDKGLGLADDDENTAQLDGELRIPAGYTYFGQFVDHDITFDPVSSLTRQNDPQALTDFRTPRYDLDSVYGRGPADQPYLYEPDGLHLALGRRVAPTPPADGPDLQRVASGRAIIGDPRNDENLVVSQLQVAVLQFHNHVVDRVRAEQPALSNDDVFKLAQQTVRWHYQWIVVHDFLRRLVGQGVIDDILHHESYATPSGKVHTLAPRLRFFHWRETPFMPIEFSVAAYRFGHSMARPSYVINDVIPLPVVPGAARIPLFSQTSGPLQNLNGFRPLPDQWGFQWKYFLPHINDVAGPNDAHLPQPAYKLDAELSMPLGALPASVASPETIVTGRPAALAQNLAARNLIRGLRLGVPAGEDVARAMGIKPLTEEQLYGEVDLSPGARADLAGRTPLWYYVLKEAEVVAHSAHLGPVGGRIVAEVLIGLLAGDPLSFLSVAPDWKPTLPSRKPGTFTLSDLVNLAKF
jgi:hypothetical protein